MSEQLIAVQARLERTQTYLDEADARVDRQRKEIAEDAKRIDELEPLLAWARTELDSFASHELCTAIDAALNGANGNG